MDENTLTDEYVYTFTCIHTYTNVHFHTYILYYMHAYLHTYLQFIHYMVLFALIILYFSSFFCISNRQQIKNKEVTDKLTAQMASLLEKIEKERSTFLDNRSEIVVYSLFLPWFWYISMHTASDICSCIHAYIPPLLVFNLDLTIFSMILYLYICISYLFWLFNLFLISCDLISSFSFL